MTASSGTSCTGGGEAGAVFAAALQFFAASQCLLEETWPPQEKLRNKLFFDFIVVGGGSAGSVVAARLSEIPEATVMLVEAGGDPPYESNIPGFKQALRGTKYDWKFLTVNDGVTSQALRGGVMPIPSGRMLGGSGALNDMVYARGSPADYNEWATVFGEEWGWDNVLKYFKKTEHLTDERIIDDPELRELHGCKGEIEVSGNNVSIYSTEKFLEAFEELGIRIVKDMASPVGAGRISHMISDGKRDGSHISLLKKASTRSNLFILKNTMATQIIIENNVAKGVKVIANGGVEKLYFAKKEVVVTAGTFNTAKLLLLSGIGPRKHLEVLGIKVVADLPVGDNFQDHPKVFIYLAAENGTCFTSQEEMYMDTMQYLYNRRGSLSWSSDLGVYISLNPHTKDIPDYAIFPSCVPVNSDIYQKCTTLGFKHYICAKLESENKYKELLSFGVELLKPKSTGKVRLLSKDPNDDPLIYTRTFSDPADLDSYPEAMHLVWSIAHTSYFREKSAYVVDLNIKGCEDLAGTELQKCLALNMVASSKHLVGTAAMGAVVDPKLRVIGVKKLRIADASVMKDVVRGNTYAPVIMVAEMASDFIKEEWFTKN